MLNVDYTLLESQGYVVLPQFLADTELKTLRQDYETNQPEVPIAYNVRFVSNTNFDLFDQKLSQVLEQIKQQTQLAVDLIIPLGRYYHNNQSAVDCFHQDHDAFYFLQQFYHYLNFWIPVTKPQADKSGLTVVPHNKLHEFSPDYAAMIRNYGACKYFPDGDSTVLVDDNTGLQHTIPINFESIAVSPVLNEGDVLLMRGDTIHKTQDHDTERLAVTIRCTNGQAPISRNKLLEFGCDDKQRRLKNSHYLVDQALTIFNSKNSDTITPTEFYADMIKYHRYKGAQIPQNP